MKYLSLFTGIGGFELGIQQAYEKNQRLVNSRGQMDSVSMGQEAEHGPRMGYTSSKQPSYESDESSPVCIGYSEIDKYATQIYQSHFPEHKNYGDITKINENELPEFDLIVGGFPCQSFSIAGKRGGFNDTRGTLFFDIARIIKVKQPRLLLLENVKGLLSHDEGRTFATIISTLDELGYDIQWQVLNSKNFGVPQNRERVFIVGHLRGTSRPEVFPIGQDGGGIVERQSIISGEIQADRENGNKPNSDSKVLEDGKDRPIHQLNQPKHNNDRVYGTDGISPTLNTMQGGLRQSFVAIPEATKKGYAEARVGQSINLAVPNSKTRRGRVSDVAQTLDTGMQQHTLTPNMKIRRLTPTECERLQGFPDDWTEGVSDTQRYKTLGNAVTVNVIKAIMESLLAITDEK